MSFRLSTLQYYKRNTEFINSAYKNVLEQQKAIASGKRIQTPSDDPVAAARINLLDERLARTERYKQNADTALDTLAIHEGNVNSMTGLITKLREVQVQSGSAIYNTSDKQALSTDVNNMLEQLMSIANTKDASGRFIYGGSVSASAPITRSGTTYTYNGDDSQRHVNITSGLEIASSDSGYDLFMDIDNGNGNFTVTTGFSSATSADPEYPFRNIGIADHTNTGSKTITSTTMYDRDLYLRNIDDYFIEFDTSGAPTTYTVYDSDGQTVVNAATYTNGTPIQFNGIEVTFDSINPVGNGDIYRLSPQPKESIFDTVQRMIINLGQNPQTTQERQSYNEENNSLLFQLEQVLNHVTNMQASVGSRMQSIERAQETNEEIILSSKSTISLLEDVDVVQAATELNSYTFSLQAAQQSFARIEDLNLFNFI